MKQAHYQEGVAQLRRSTVALLVIAALGTFLPGATAGISSTVFAITATNDSGSSSYSVDFSSGTWDPVAGDYTWSLGGPMDLVDDADPGIVVASLSSATLVIHTKPTPEITLNLGVSAGDSNTYFYVDSAVVDFSTIPAAAAEGRFSAGAQIWDTGFDGAYLVGADGSGVGAFQSYYNGTAPSGTRFSHLVGAIVVGNGGSGSASQAFPSVGYAAIGANLNDISTHGAFVVSGGDRMVGSMSFGIVPEPSTSFMVLCLGAFWVFRGQDRRR